MPKVSARRFTGSKLEQLAQLLDQCEQERVPLLQRALVMGNSVQLLTAFTVAVPTDWTTLSLLNSFTALAGYTPCIRKSSNGDTVFVRGAVTIPAGPPANGTAFATIPSAYAPDLSSPSTGVLLLPALMSDAANEIRASSSQLTVGFGPAMVPGDFLSCFTSWTPNDRTPIIPSSFPVDVPHSLAVAPQAVFIASCVDTNNSASPPAWPALTPQWTQTPGVPNSIRVLNIPGLLPGHTYSIRLLAIGA